MALWLKSKTPRVIFCKPKVKKAYSTAQLTSSLAKPVLILQQNSGVGVKPLFYYSNIPTHKLRVIYNHS